MTPRNGLIAALLAAPLLLGAAHAGEGAHALRSRVPGNAFAFIPPQCYTRTIDASGGVHNPCYTCHVASAAPNYADDGELQTVYDFPDPALKNPWTNLFVDRRAAIAAMPRAEIEAYAAADNYHGPDGLTLAARLDPPPAAWDVDGDGAWSGYVPDIWFAFDAEGYDRAPDGRRTGWRAFAYVPLPGGFWPTNGGADDVSIRLPAPFREDAAGREDWTVYGVNLAIVEALVKRRDVAIPAVDEAAFGLDLDRDGRIGTATRIAYAFDPRTGVTMHYAGRAGAEGSSLAPGLFPRGTEFVHSLRYLAVAPDGTVGPAPRMKELRYARKTGWRTYWELREAALAESREEHDYPERAETFLGDLERGITTGHGWRFQGFIEDAAGALRPQTYEESLTCAGCHAGVGRTVDDTFSFARKLNAPEENYGWYAWSASQPLGALADPRRADGTGEYATYLARNGAGDEFRANAEIIERYLGSPATAADLDDGIAGLVMPSPDRAIALDKAYRLIVEEQSFRLGRLPVLAPLDASVHRELAPGTLTGITVPVD